MSQLENNRRRIYSDLLSKHDYALDYTTIVSLEDLNDILFKREYESGSTRYMSVSLDNGKTWTQYANSYEGTLLATLNKGDRLLLKSTTNGFFDDQYHFIASTGKFNLEGNIMSISLGDNFRVSDFPYGSSYNYRGLFRRSNVVDIHNLKIPAKTIPQDCFESTFASCPYLVTVMELPSLTLGSSCYFGMFQNCPSLTESPILPAKKLSGGCYGAMFYNSINVKKITMLATDISANRCLDKWVHNVAATGTFIKDSAMTNLPTGESGIPDGWTVIDYE